MEIENFDLNDNSAPRTIPLVRLFPNYDVTLLTPTVIWLTSFWSYKQNHLRVLLTEKTLIGIVIGVTILNLVCGIIRGSMFFVLMS